MCFLLNLTYHTSSHKIKKAFFLQYPYLLGFFSFFCIDFNSQHFYASKKLHLISAYCQELDVMKGLFMKKQTVSKRNEKPTNRFIVFREIFRCKESFSVIDFNNAMHVSCVMLCIPV